MAVAGVLATEQFWEQLSLPTLVQTCLVSHETQQRCRMELQRRIQPRGPELSLAQLLVRVRQVASQRPWTVPVEPGEEVLFSLEEVLFRVGLLGDEATATYLLGQLGASSQLSQALEPLLFGLAFGGHNQLGQQLLQYCTINGWPCQQLGSIFTTVPYLSKEMLELLTRRNYRSIIRYWYELTPYPDEGLDIIAQTAALNHQLSLLRWLTGPPFWYVVPAYIAIKLALTTGNMLLLDLSIPPGGERDHYLLRFDKNYYPYADQVNAYYLQEGLVLPRTEDVNMPRPLPGPLPRSPLPAWLSLEFLVVDSQYNAEVAKGQQPLTGRHQRPNEAIDMIEQAAQHGNWEVVRQLVQNFCHRSPYVLAAPLAERRESGIFTSRPSPWQVQLFSYYQQLGVVTPAVAEAILELAGFNDKYYVRKTIITNGLEINRGRWWLELQHIPWDQLTVHTLIYRIDIEDFLESGLRDPIIWGKIITLLTGPKSGSREDRCRWMTVLDNLLDPLYSQFLLWMAQYTQDLSDFIDWLGSTHNETRDPTLLIQLHSILCERWPQYCPQLTLGFQQLLATPPRTIVNFPLQLPAQRFEERPKDLF